MKKMLFVVNPNSGKALIKNRLLEIVKILSAADYEVTLYPTKAPRDGYRYVLESEGKFDVISCSGGDGTLNEVVGAILKYQGEKPPIGYIPSGSTNDFATSLNIPKDMIRAAEHIARGTVFPCDIGIANGERNFNYVAAFGAFTEVSYATPQSLKNVLGHQAYVIEAVKSFAALKPHYMRICSEEKNIQGNYVYGMVSNTESVGGMKGLTGTGIDLRDGYFEVTLIKEIRNPMDFQMLVTAFLTQSFDKCERMYTFKTKHISFESQEPVSWTLDGEFGGEHEKIEFDVLHEAVEFIVKSRR
ncbi:MAG: diacylglycerol kinase family lipid kinase [Lachnospira sp.]|jgi:YegS/Rv2252/BmrU family lipid kinase|nr:diacylglycerol kinase family lipid kinase [Lachnospira sp.]